MPVIKSKLQTNYFIYPNSVAQSNLSLEAKGLIAYMSSKPDDWVFHKEVIKSECGIGKDKLNRLFNELINKGHLKSTQFHGEDGRFLRNETVFFVEPENNPAPLPFTENPSTVHPLTVEQPLQSKDINKVKINTNICQQIADAWNESFNELPNVIKVSDKRKAHINAAIKFFKNVHDLEKKETWLGIFEYAKQSDFLMGRSTNWCMDFDFIINKNNLLKVLEGKYE